MSHEGNMALYGGIKASVDLMKAVDEFEDRYDQAPTRIVLHGSATHILEQIDTGSSIVEVELGSKALTPPREHAFLFLREAQKHESPFETNPNTD